MHNCGIEKKIAFCFKPQYALDDTISCLCAAVLRCCLGAKIVWVHLDSYEAKCLLIIEKETDVLTGIYNRRKLFETPEHLEKESS